jgi:hypothetical protein
MPVFWLIWAMVCGLPESLNVRTTASPRASEVMKLGSVSASISSAIVSSRASGASRAAGAGRFVVDFVMAEF